MKWLTHLLYLMYVPRWTINRVTHHQSVAEHSFNVAMIAFAIQQELSLTTSEYFILYCLFHDADESLTGDIPRPAKKLLGLPSGLRERLVPVPLPAPSALDKRVAKLADLLEAYIFIRREGQGFACVAIGNDYYSEIKREVTRFVEDFDLPGGSVTKVYKLIDSVLKDSGRPPLKDEPSAKDEETVN